MRSPFAGPVAQAERCQVCGQALAGPLFEVGGRKLIHRVCADVSNLVDELAWTRRRVGAADLAVGSIVLMVKDLIRDLVDPPPGGVDHERMKLDLEGVAFRAECLVLPAPPTAAWALGRKFEKEAPGG